MNMYIKKYVWMIICIATCYILVGDFDAHAIEENKIASNNEQSDYVLVEKGTHLYTKKGTDTGVKLTRSLSFSYKKSTMKGFYTIEVGEQSYLVKEEDAPFLTENKIKIENKKNLFLKTKKSYTIYEDASLKSSVLWRGNESTTFKVLQNKGTFLIVQIGNQKGFINTKDFVIQYTKQNYELLEKQTIIQVKNSKKTRIGTVVAGAVVHVVKFDQQYAYLQTGKTTFVVAKSSLLPTKRSVSFNKQQAQKYPVTIFSEKNHAVYNKKGIKIGEIAKGKAIALINVVNGKGLIRFANYTGYVSLTNYTHNNLVDGSKAISYNLYAYQLSVLAAMYPKQTQRIKIGESVQGRAIYAFKLGTGKKEIYMDASTHAREHMTTNVLMKMIDTYTKAYTTQNKLYNYDVEKVLNTTSIWFVPMVNPDGVMLVQQGLKSVQEPYKQKVLKANDGSKNFARYKSNIRGVDLNRNYNVAWKATSTSIKKPYYKAYKGPSAVSEPETKAMVNFVKKHSFKTYLAYHSSGQLQYWYYNQSVKQKKRDYYLVQKIYNVTKYNPVTSTGIANGSGAGQDWFVSTFKRPGITIEIAPYVGETTVPHKYWSSVWNKNKSVGLLAAKEAAGR